MKSIRIEIKLENCIGCGKCVEICPTNVFPTTLIGYISSIPEIEHEKCNGCGKCVEVCPYKAIQIYEISR